MARRFCVKDIPAHCLPPEERTRAPRPKRSKYHNVPVTVDGMRFPSKREACYYEVLKLRVAAGEIEGFIPQVSIPIGGGARMQIDFLIIPKGMRLDFRDPKGFATREWTLKKKIAEGLYPIQITLV